MQIHTPPPRFSVLLFKIVIGDSNEFTSLISFNHVSDTVMMSNWFLDNMASNSVMFDINDYVFRSTIVSLRFWMWIWSGSFNFFRCPTLISRVLKMESSDNVHSVHVHFFGICAMMKFEYTIVVQKTYSNWNIILELTSRTCEFCSTGV